MIKCPNKETAEWKYLVDNLGETGAYKVFIKYDEVPPMDMLPKIVEANKPSIKKLLQFYNANVSGFLPRTVIIEHVKRDIKKLNLNAEVKQAANGSYYVTQGGRKVSFYSLDSEGDRDIEMENKLKDILTNSGIRVEAYETLTGRLGVDASGAADILNRVVYISDKAGFETLPEETAHFFIEGLGTDNPLVKRLMDTITEHPIYREVTEDYKDIYTTEEEFRKEAVGKILGKYIIQEYKNTKEYTIWEKFKGTLNLILDRIIQMFTKSRISNDVEKAAEEIYGQFASQILSGSIPYSNADTVMYQVKGKLKDIDTIIREKIKSINTRLDYYEKAIGDDQNESSVKVREFVASTREEIENIEADSDPDSAYIKLLTIAKEDIEDVNLRLEGPISNIGISRALSFIEAYSGLSDIKTDNPVIKKIAADIESLRKEVKDKLLSITQERIVSEFDIQTDSSTNIEELLRPEADISWDQRWFGAIANSEDPILAGIDKKYKSEVLDRSVEESLRFEAEHDRLYNKVNKGDLPLLIENTEEGDRITSKYTYDYYKLLAETGKLAKEHPEDYNYIWRNFFESNHSRGYRNENNEWVRGEPLPMYENPNYKVIQSKPELKAYYDFIVRNKTIADNIMGLGQYKGMRYRLPYFKQDFIESVSTHGIVKAMGQLGSRFKDSILYTKDTSRVMLDEKGEEIKSILRPGTGTGDYQSQDIGKVMKMYMNGAVTYKAKRELQGIVELSRTYVEAREIPKTNWLGKVKDQSGDYVTIEGAATLAYQRFNDWYNMIYIGDTEKDEGAFKIFGKEISKQKAAKAFGRYNSLTSLAFNLFSGAANIIYGESMQIIEAAGGEYYSAKDYAWATKTYAKNALSTKMDLMLKHFRALQDTTEFGKKNNFHKLFNPFLFNQTGEHLLQARLFLAMIHKVKVKDNQGNEYNLWDAYEEVDGELKLKKGIQIDKGTLSDIRSKVSAVNQRLHGRYTSEDQAAINKYSLGFLAMQYRKWIHPGYEARFRGAYYDKRLDQVIKGRYRSYTDFFRGIKEMKSLLKGWESLSNHDKANMKRNIMELIQFTGTVLLLNALRAIADDDDLDNSKAFNFALYQIDRFSTEIKFFNIGIFTGDLTKLIRTPAASISTIENMGRLLNDSLKYPFRDEEENLVRGKDYSKVERDMEKLIPLIKEMRRWSNIEDQANYFKTY